MWKSVWLKHTRPEPYILPLGYCVPPVTKGQSITIQLATVPTTHGLPGPSFLLLSSSWLGWPESSRTERSLQSAPTPGLSPMYSRTEKSMLLRCGSQTRAARTAPLIKGAVVNVHALPILPVRRLPPEPRAQPSQDPLLATGFLPRKDLVPGHHTQEGLLPRHPVTKTQHSCGTEGSRSAPVSMEALGLPSMSCGMPGLRLIVSNFEFKCDNPVCMSAVGTRFAPCVSGTGGCTHCTLSKTDVLLSLPRLLHVLTST